MREHVGALRRGPYVTPSHGFILGQYVLGRTAHAYPVRSLVEPVREVHRGDIIQVGDWASIKRTSAALADRGIQGTSLSDLLGG
jgi:hypothetical protein